MPRCAEREAAIGLLKDVFENGLIEKITHDLKYALCLLDEAGIHLENAVDDTSVQAYLLNTERAKNELPVLAQEYLGEDIQPVEDGKTPQTADLSHRPMAAAGNP